MASPPPRETFLLIAGPWQGRIDANRHHDLGPECNGQAGKDHNKSANQGFRARAAGRVLIAVTVDVKHRILAE
jgi:hypothetical protein